MRSALFWDIKQRRMVIFTDLSGLSVSSISKSQEVQVKKTWTGPIFRPETSVKDYHLTLRNIPEERRSHQHRGGSLKSRKKCLAFNGIYLALERG
jgi:hypothetical protein